MGNVLDLNDSINQESQFVDVPEGEYDARIDHVEAGLCSWDGQYNGNLTTSCLILILSGSSHSCFSAPDRRRRESRCRISEGH